MLISKYGKRFTCYKCDCLFYDLNKEKAICPRCGADQAEGPSFETKPAPRPKKKAPPRKLPTQAPKRPEARPQAKN